jgi:threonine aldolase
VHVVDLRSDTVTMPSPEMRQAMATAPLGDDVFGDDPTVNRLLEVAAERLGKEAAVFVPSGTMGNLIGVAVNAGLGEELIADAQSHIFVYETAGAAAVAGVQIRRPTQPAPTACACIWTARASSTPRSRRGSTSPTSLRAPTRSRSACPKA